MLKINSPIAIKPKTLNKAITGLYCKVKQIASKINIIPLAK